KTSHGESLGTPANKSNTNPMPKDIQVSPHVALGGQFTQRNLPAHFLDAFRNGSAIADPAILHSCANASLMQNSFQLVGTQSPSLGLRPSIQSDTTQGKQFIGTEDLNADQQQRQPVVQQDRQDDMLEDQMKREMTAQKWQEARKKRKQLIEEQKQQKKAKKEDERAGTHGFRRPGSNTWDMGQWPTPSVANMEMSKTNQDIQEGGNQMHEIACTFQRGRDKNTEDSEQETDEESSESQEEQSDISDNAFLPTANVEKIGKSLSGAKEGGKFPNSNKDPTEVGQYMTARSNGFLKIDEKEQDYRMLASLAAGKPPIHCTTTGNNSNTALANFPTTTTVAMTSAALPFSVPPFPVMPAPYSLPTPVPSHPNVPFPVGYPPFVYLMQYPPPAVDGTNCTAARPPIYPNGFQLPLGYAPFQLPTLEASPSWVPVLRSQQSPSFSPNLEAARTSSEPIEGEPKVSQGVKSHNKQMIQVSLSTDDTSEQTNSSLNRSDSLHDIQDQWIRPDLHVMSALSITP
ncbi:hypothetical protein KI387_007486, partial [Taxus chinensis]